MKSIRKIKAINKKIIPKIGQIYHAFDDGKITMMRHYVIKITNIIPYKKIDRERFNFWKDSATSAYWLYRKKTDYFIIGKAIDDNGNEDKVEDEEIFVRTINNRWFSIGWPAGLLDVTGNSYDMLLKYLDKIG